MAFHAQHSTFVLGTETGHVMRCQQPERSHGELQDPKLFRGKWSNSAKNIVNRAANAPEILRHVLAYTKQRGVREIKLDTVYRSKPPLEQLYANANEFPFQPHAGPVYAIDWSPFHRNVFASCSIDGTIHISTVLQVRSSWTRTRSHCQFL